MIVKKFDCKNNPFVYQNNTVAVYKRIFKIID